MLLFNGPIDEVTLGSPNPFVFQAGLSARVSCANNVLIADTEAVQLDKSQAGRRSAAMVEDMKPATAHIVV